MRLLKNLEKNAKRWILKLLLFFNPIQRNTPLPEFNKSSRVLLIRLNRIGDALVTTPWIRELRMNIDCHIYVLASQDNFIAFKNNPDFREIFIYGKGIKAFWKTLKLLKQYKFDAIVDLHDDVSTTVSLFVALLKAPFKFAMEKENRKLFTHTAPRPNPKLVHVVGRYFPISDLFSFEPAKNILNIQFTIGKEANFKAEEFRKKKYPNEKFLLGINISAGSAARFWGSANYRKLVKFLNERNVATLLLCSTRDLKQALEITNDKIHVFYSPSFEEFAAMIKNINFLFSPDTSIIHIASVFKIPVFGLYVQYKTQDKIWSPYRSEFDSIVTEEPNLHNITYESVIEKFHPFLNKFTQC